LNSNSNFSCSCDVLRLDLHIRPLTLSDYTGWPKSHFTQKKWNISIMAQANELIFSPVIEACTSFISIKTCLGRPFVKYHYWPQQEKFYFFTDRKKTIYLTEGLCRHVFMDMKLEHASIIGKKISSFAWAVTKIFNFYFGKLTFGPLCIRPKSHDTEKKLNISATARANGLIFLPIIEACSNFKSIQTRLERPFVKYH
jgi:hypothetical protein